MEWLTANAWWIRFLVELGILAGVAWLVYINKFHYKQSLEAKDEQIKVKDAEIALLERTQPKYLMDELDAMKRYSRELREGYEIKINEITASKAEKDKLIYDLKEMVAKLEAKATSTITLSTNYWKVVAKDK